MVWNHRLSVSGTRGCISVTVSVIGVGGNAELSSARLDITALYIQFDNGESTPEKLITPVKIVE